VKINSSATIMSYEFMCILEVEGAPSADNAESAVAGSENA
jgi:hypothetical protein